MMLKLINEKPLEDINSKGFIYAHSSGAKIIFIENDDENRVFSITFKTMPDDDTGVCHIMEHCVLCGSEEYRVKDPFNELDKGSLNTYLNAITFADKTMYPIGSTNEKDFENLIRVYLDAVFFPLIYENKAVFLQEGYHYGEDGINGIVYNEMKGVFSEPEGMLEYKVRQRLFDETPYRYDSGGFPEKITDLSYEKFLDFHRKNYHPSNSVIYLYGKIEKEKYFNIIEKYLSRFEYRENNNINYVQKDSGNIKFTQGFYYSQEEEENGNFLQAGFITCRTTDYIETAGMEILCDILFGNEASPVKNMLIEKGICSNVYGYVDTDVYESVLMIYAQHSEDESTDRFRSIIEEGVRKSIEEGFDKKLVEGCINSYEFYLREEDFGYKPKGLYYNILLMQSIRYGEESLDILEIKKNIERIKKINFEKLAERYILNNTRCCYGILKMKNEGEKERKYKYERNDEELRKYREKNDSIEELRKIPMIKISDIDRNKIFRVKNETENRNGLKVIFNEIEKSDIMYINLAVDTSYLPFDIKKYADMFRYMLGKVDSINYGYRELSNEISRKTGDFGVYFSLYENINNGEFNPLLIVNVKVLNENALEAVRLMEEVLCGSIFSDKERIGGLLGEMLAKRKDSMIFNGNYFAETRSRAYFDKPGVYREMLCGYESVKAIKECTENRENTCMVFEKIKEMLFLKENITFNISGEKGKCERVIKEFEKIYDRLGKRESDRKFIYEPIGNLKERIKIDGDVNFNALSADIREYGYKYSGKMRVLEKIAEADYLWNTVRVQGGAYGGRISIGRNGIIQMSSYRDPNYDRTFDFYRRADEYMKNLGLEEREFRRFIIGAINKTDTPVKNNQIGEIGMYREFTGIDEEFLEREREEILNCKIEDIKKLGILFKKIAESDYRCSLLGRNNY